MLRRTMAVALALALALTAGTALAQENCTIGVYADANGTVGLFKPTELVNFNIYVVAFAEDVMNAAAYGLVNPDPANLFIVSELYGPSGSGINVPDIPGDRGTSNVGLGECAVGFGGQPIVVATYTALVTSSFGGGDVCVVPNPFRNELEDPPTQAQYNTCQDILKPCALGPCLLVEDPVGSDSVSFGAVKALY